MKLLLALLVVVVSACGSSNSATSPSPAATAGSPSPAAIPLYYVGDTISATNGNSFTVYSYVPSFETGNQFEVPKPGNVFAAIDVQECAGSSGSSANPFDWALRMPDNSRITPSAGWKDPPLNAVNLAAGDCVRGWVTFEVPQGITPAFVVLTNSTNIRWVMHKP
jgi:hypothetical protein